MSRNELFACSKSKEEENHDKTGTDSRRGFLGVEPATERRSAIVALKLSSIIVLLKSRTKNPVLKRRIFSLFRNWAQLWSNTSRK